MNTFYMLPDIFKYLFYALGMVLFIFASMLSIQLRALKAGRREIFYSVLILIISALICHGFANFSDWYIGTDPLNGFGKIIRSTPIIILILIFLILILSMLGLRKIFLRKNIFDADIIKKTIDGMPDGICFSYKDGTPLLVNKAMHYLSYELFGHIMLNANEFYKNLKVSRVNYDIRIIKRGREVILKTADKAWDIKYFYHGNIRETLAVDISEEYSLTEEISNRNIRLYEVNGRLRQYSKDVERFTREKEILDAKIKIHDDIGRSLAAFRSYLENDKRTEEDREGLLSLWRKSIFLMRGEAEDIHEDTLWENLLLAAKSVGVDIEVNGSLEIIGDYIGVFIAAVHECLNNAVRHARGSRLDIFISETDGKINIEIENDGKEPSDPIVEKGGLSNIRKKIELGGGEMKIESSPRFCLKIGFKAKAPL